MRACSGNALWRPTLAMVTDYDCWRPHEDHVTAEMAIANLMKNAARAQTIAVSAIQYLAENKPDSAAHHALASGLVTSLDQMPENAREQVRLFIENSYL